jgi:pimeloyl-ACP methyl ester carboxylesterase
MPGVLAHRVDGSGPPLVLLNGGLMSLTAWEPVAQALAARFRVIRCDFRGQLLSPGEPPATIDGHALDLRRLLDQLGLPRVHVAGTSFGAFVGFRLALLCPERAASLALIAATDRIEPGSAEAGLGRALRQACRAAADGGDAGALLDLLAQQSYSPAWLAAHSELLLKRRQQMASLPRPWFRAVEGFLDALEGLDLRSELGQVRCPSLVVAAELDRTFPPAASRALAAGLKEAALEVVAGVGHAAVVEAPDRLACILESFLTRVTLQEVSA